jgi:hypothetical protein
MIDCLYALNRFCAFACNQPTGPIFFFLFFLQKQYPGGFSGDIGDGPTDAYKALEPKPWKPSKSA